MNKILIVNIYLLLICVTQICKAQANFNVTPTNQFATFLGQATLNNLPTEAIDSIAAFDETGNCAGAAAITFFEGVGYINLIIYGDDSGTPEDEGMNNGELFSLKFYDASSNTIIDYEQNGIVFLFPGWQNTNGVPLSNYNNIDDIYNFNCTDCTEVFDTELNVKIFLEGAYEVALGKMEKKLLDANLIPLNQPYNQDPWNYNGTESVANTTDFPANAVDWVLVELRSGTPMLSGSQPGTALVERKAGILTQAGFVINPNGTNVLFEMLNEGEEYHILIRHRNHLDIISATPVIAAASIFYDFTTNINQAFGIEQQKAAADGVGLMYSGDFTADGIIQVTDFDLWEAESAILETYSRTDANLDGVVQVIDYDYWFFNKAKIGTIDIQ